MFKQNLGVGIAVALTAAVMGAVPATRSELTVHEWGTFTTVAGEDGRAVAWRPVDGPIDLPCFVERANLPPKVWFTTTVRMETPVIYFYAPQPLTVDVAVGFRQGLMTEFFPRPTSSGERRTGLLATETGDHLEWNGVRVLPGSAPDYPTERAPNHYYAARSADAAPLQLGTEREGFLFYRGVGGFELPLRATIAPDRGVELRQDGDDPISSLMFFENRAGRVGFWTSRLPDQAVSVPPLGLDSDPTEVHSALVDLLIAEGLFRKEAEAMIETWRDSWFEEGTRVFYIVPKPLVDRTLPLSIHPSPRSVERVFVGRLEIAAPWLLEDLRQAFAALDHKTLAERGRFLEPFSRRILSGSLPTDERSRILGLLAEKVAASQAYSGRPCTATTE